MDKLLGFLNLSTLRLKENKDDDFVDRLNHRYTTFLFVIFGVVVTTRQYVGDPINCWAPAHFTSNYIDYTNKICWVSNTYYIPFYVLNIPEDREPRKQINYYQWVPMILLVQSILYHVPHAVWKALNSRAGLDLSGIIGAASMLQYVDLKRDRDDVIKQLAIQLNHYLLNARQERKGRCTGLKSWLAHFTCLVCGRRYGNYQTTLYLITKAMYVGNSISQLFLLNAFLRTNFLVYGIEVVHHFMGDFEWGYSERFPRVTLCDFIVRQLANTHRHTVQCVLPINC